MDLAKTTSAPSRRIGADDKSGAGERIRTVNIHLGKVVLYQLSYARGQMTSTPRSSLTVKPLRQALADDNWGRNKARLTDRTRGFVGQ